MSQHATGTDAAAALVDPGAVPLSRGLSTKLLLLTIIFVLLAEVLIFLPSVANFRLQWLEERLRTAAAVSIVLVRSDAAGLSREIQDDVLTAIGAKAIAIREGGVSRLLAVAEMPPEVDEHIDLSEADPLLAITRALGTLFSGGGRMLRVFGSPAGPAGFELVLPDRGLREAMLVYSRNVALLSLIISLFTAVLVYTAIDRVMIRPIRGITRSMLAFAQAPNDPARIIRPGTRSDEIGVAERELEEMQTTLQRIFGEQKHLADLGLAVSKINHDMRNILASAQLISDRLRRVQDPTVQTFAPKLLSALDRAVSYSEDVLAYGGAREPVPARRRLRLAQLVEEVHGLLGIEPAGGIEFVNAVDADFEVDADPEQLFRVLMNLGRNALQAMAADKESALVRRLVVSAERSGSVARILVADTGPGLPAKARQNLFAAFRGSARAGGTGLGLAIAYELARAHGGSLDLVESVGGRTVFALTIPDQPLSLSEARNALRRPA